MGKSTSEREVPMKEKEGRKNNSCSLNPTSLHSGTMDRIGCDSDLGKLILSINY